MACFIESSLRLTRVVRVRKLWTLVAGPKSGSSHAKVTLSHPYHLHLQFLAQMLEIASIFIAFGGAVLIRVRYDQTLPVGVVVTSFFVQISLEIFFDAATLLFESSLMGFTVRASLYLEHMTNYSYFVAAMKSIITLPLMSAVWVSCIAVVGR